MSNRYMQIDVPIDLVPEDWTTDPIRVQSQLIWGTPAGYGYEMARDRGLDAPRPLMHTTPESEELFYFFEAGGEILHLESAGRQCV